VRATVDNVPCEFLVDTGASLSCIPPSLFGRTRGTLDPSNVIISTCSDQPLKVHGETFLPVVFPSLRRSFDVTFVVCDVATPILGLDFLSDYNMVVDCRRRRFLDATTTLSATLYETDEVRCGQLKFDVPAPELMPEVKSLAPKDRPLLPAEHSIEIGSARPPFARARRLHGAKLEAARLEIEKFLKLGYIRPSKSDFASPIHLVKKPDGTWRVTGDYRALNSLSTPDRYPIPNLQNFTERLRGCKMFSRINLVKAFHQVPMKPEDVKKTAITTPFGLYEFVVMPMGLRNSPQTFQRCMDTMFRDLPFCFVYLDDILIASRDAAEHETHLKKCSKF